MRIMEKEVCMKDQEIFKLDMGKKQMNSELLEPRINGIRELNQVIENNKSWSMTKTLSVAFLVQWMTENNVFNIIWDPRKTHQQLIERSDKVFKLLLDENYMTNELLQKFWDLSSEYKSEVYKIINDNSYYLK